MESTLMQPRTRFERQVILDEAEISAFARAAGDENPLHHDAAFARLSRYGGIIASGPQTSALLMGCVASHFSRVAPMVGLEFRFVFRSAVPANHSLRLQWLVIKASPTRSGSGRIVELRGRLQLANGDTAVGAAGTVLVHSPISAG